MTKKQDGTYRETIDGMGVTCSQCDQTDLTHGGKLYVYYTIRDGRRRTHNGSFCSKHCHDVFHGLRPARKSA